ncbi:MAG: hypothetical protein ACRDAO_06295 [Culicoidibacterales bacterium]
MLTDQFIVWLLERNFQELEQSVPVLTQCHTPIYDTLTWGEVYPLLSQWIQQIAISVTHAKTITINKISVSEWVVELQNGNTLSLCCLIDPTTIHGMDIRMYHSFYPLYNRVQNRELLPIQTQVQSLTLNLKFADDAYYIPAFDCKRYVQGEVAVDEAFRWLQSSKLQVHAVWQDDQTTVIEYTYTDTIGLVVVEYNDQQECVAVRNYNDWEQPKNT